MTIDNEASVKPTTQFINDTISTLHHQGLSITESIKVLMSNYQISLHDAKFLVSQHPVWHTVTTAAEPLHQEIVSVLENVEKGHSEKTQRVFRSASFKNSFFMKHLSLNLAPLALTKEQFVQVCRANPELRLELTNQGELIIAFPD